MDLAVLTLPVIMALALLTVDSSQMLDLAKFALFYFFVVLPASYVLGRWLLSSLSLTPLERTVLGYPAAIGLYSGLFYFVNVLGVVWLLYLVALLFLALGFVLSRGAMDEKIGLNHYLSFAVLYLLVACLFFATFSITTFTPTTEAYGLYYQDSLWTVGNTWAIIRDGFPVTDARFDGTPFAYHMVQSVYLAMVHQFTGIDPFDLHLRIAPLFDLFFLVGVVYFGARAFLGASIRFASGLTFSLFFTAGALSWLSAGYLGHIYMNPLSMFFGLSAYFAILYLVGSHSLSDRVFVIYTALVALVAFASKASLVFSLLPALFLYMVIRLWRGYRMGYRDLALALSIGLVLVVLNDTLYKGVGGGLVWQEYTALDAAQIQRLSGFLGELIAETLAPLGVVIKPVVVVGRYAANILLSLYVLTFFIVWAANQKFRISNQAANPFFAFIAAISLFSALWPAIFTFNGGEIYFLWYSVIAWVIPFYYAVHYFAFEKPNWLHRSVAVVMMLIGFSLFVT